jgi:hypothetical protein
MAFTIETGTVTDYTELLAKIKAAWTWDVTGGASVTYGDCVLSLTGSNSNGFSLAIDGTTIAPALSAGYTTAYFYAIAKTANTIIISFTVADNQRGTIVAGNVKNIDGTTGKGMLIVNGQDTANWGAGFETASQTNKSDTIRISDRLTQFVPYTSDRGGWYFENAYRMLIGTSASALNGEYLSGDDRYYISQRTAIKEE